jgi:hypothetical protein
MNDVQVRIGRHLNNTHQAYLSIVMLSMGLGDMIVSFILRMVPTDKVWQPAKFSKLSKRTTFLCRLF